MPTPTVQQVVNYANANSIELTPSEIDQAVNLVDNDGYSISEAVIEVDTNPPPEKPRG